MFNRAAPRFSRGGASCLKGTQPRVKRKESTVPQAARARAVINARRPRIPSPGPWPSAAGPFQILGNSGFEPCAAIPTVVVKREQEADCGFRLGRGGGWRLREPLHAPIDRVSGETKGQPARNVTHHPMVEIIGMGWLHPGISRYQPCPAGWLKIHHPLGAGDEAISIRAPLARGDLRWRGHGGSRWRLRPCAGKRLRG
jgi:hypothetical protein